MISFGGSVRTTGHIWEQITSCCPLPKAKTTANENQIDYLYSRNPQKIMYRGVIQVRYSRHNRRDAGPVKNIRPYLLLSEITR